MTKLPLAGMLALGGIISAVSAADVRVGNVALPPNAQKWIPVLVTGGEMVSGMNFAVQVGDGGPANGGVSTKPVILDLDTTGLNTVFHDSHLGSSPHSLGGLIWVDSLLTDDTVAETVPAAGVLAWVKFDTSGTTVADDPYGIHLENVGPVSDATELLGENITTTLFEGQIYIRNLETMTWNKSGSGLWREIQWSGSPQDYPNYITDAVIATPFTVTIDNPSPLPSVQWLQEAHSLTLSNGGHVIVDPRVTLSLAAASPVGAGSLLELRGDLEAQNLSLSGGTLQIDDGGTAHVADLSGTGTVHVGGGAGTATLTAQSLRAATLIIGAGSKVTIGPSSAAGGLPQSSAAPVPEPGALLLLGMAGLWWLCRRMF